MDAPNPSSPAQSDVRRVHARLALKWGKRGHMPDADGFNRIYSSVWEVEWNDPCGIALGPDGHVYVTDRRNARVQRFGPDGEFVDAWGSSHGGRTGGHNGPRDGALRYPHGIAVDRHGFAYVVDAGNCRIQKFKDGLFVLKWGGAGTGPGEFMDPHSVAVGPSDTVYVTDGTCDGANRVQAFSPGGRFLFEWGERGSGPGQFRGPGGVAVDREGRVYVADIDNCRIQKFTDHGEHLASWGGRGCGWGEFQFPNGVAVGPGGCVFVADTYNHRIQAFTPSGDCIGGWGDRVLRSEAATYPRDDQISQGDFENPRAVAFSPQGDAYVIDSFTHWARKYRVRVEGV